VYILGNRTAAVSEPIGDHLLDSTVDGSTLGHIK
jgi:hypothetical protein